MSFFEINRLYKSFDVEGSKCDIINNLNFVCEKGEFISFVGPSGCGKSTLLNMIAGYIMPDRGSIVIGGEVVVSPDHNKGVIFQDDALFPWLTVEKNIGYGLRCRGVDDKIVQRKVNVFVEAFGLENISKSYPKTLSGGEKKKVDMARTIINDPKLLIMDEPFVSLDLVAKEKLQLFLIQYYEGAGKTIIFVTHDVEEAVLLSDRICVMTSSPSSINQIISIPIDRPRKMFYKYTPIFQEIRKKISDEIEKL